MNTRAIPFDAPLSKIHRAKGRKEHFWRIAA
jgi:hypothetical protein